MSAPDMSQQHPLVLISRRFRGVGTGGDITPPGAPSNSSVTDSNGDTYILAVGPTVNSGAGTATINYAPNIGAAAANANTVTVTWNVAVPAPEVRITECSGISTTNPLDVTAAATGTLG